MEDNRGILLAILVVWLVIIILGFVALSGGKTVYEEEETAEAVVIEASYAEAEQVIQSSSVLTYSFSVT